MRLGVLLNVHYAGKILMIISEKQIMQLMDLCKIFALRPNIEPHEKNIIVELLRDILNQQSKELRKFDD